jgi:hypothetical protein
MEGNHQICPFVFSSTFQQLSFQMSKFGGHLLKEQINLYFYKQIQIQEIIKAFWTEWHRVNTEQKHRRQSETNLA